MTAAVAAARHLHCPIGPARCEPPLRRPHRSAELSSIKLRRSEKKVGLGGCRWRCISLEWCWQAQCRHTVDPRVVFHLCHALCDATLSMLSSLSDSEREQQGRGDAPPADKSREAGQAAGARGHRGGQDLRAGELVNSPDCSLAARPCVLGGVLRGISNVFMQVPAQPPLLPGCTPIGARAVQINEGLSDTPSDKLDFSLRQVRPGIGGRK